MFADQSDIGLHPPIGAQWGERGVQDRVRSRGKNRKVHLFGALDAHTETLYAGFWARKNSDAFIEFLRALLKSVPRRTIHLVLDNYGVHKSRKTCQFLASKEARRIRITFLPTYSPWLNPIERTWRLIKGRAATNRWRDSIEQLVSDFSATMTQLGATVWQPTSPLDKE
jgi:putative transposase